jgi:PT repeat
MIVTLRRISALLLLSSFPTTMVSEQIVISELMINPKFVNQSNGTWIEFYNMGSLAVDMGYFRLRLFGTSGSLFTRLITVSKIIPAKGYFVVGNNADITANGGVAVDWVYGSEVLSTSSGGVVLCHNVTLKCDVNFIWGGSYGVPLSFSPGVSLLYKRYSDQTSFEQAGNVTNWCPSVVAYNAKDLGTPGKVGSCTVGPPTKPPTKSPTKAPAKPTKTPTRSPTTAPTKRPTRAPSKSPTKRPTKGPTKIPTRAPTKAPTRFPTKGPTKAQPNVRLLPQRPNPSLR